MNYIQMRELVALEKGLVIIGAREFGVPKILSD